MLEHTLCKGEHCSNPSQAVTHSILTALGGTQFTEKDAEAWDGYITCSRSHSKKQNLLWLPGSLAPEHLQLSTSSQEDLGLLLSQETQPQTSHQSLGANQTPSSGARHLGTMPFHSEAPNLRLSLAQTSVPGSSKPKRSINNTQALRQDWLSQECLPVNKAGHKTKNKPAAWLAALHRPTREHLPTFWQCSFLAASPLPLTNPNLTRPSTYEATHTVPHSVLQQTLALYCMPCT